MVVELTVENLAIIERAQISLGPGYTVLTGETGAGKSLLIDAIELAFGSRADTDLVRSGASRAAVSVVLDLSAQPSLVRLCADLGVALEDNALYIHREVFAEGRSQCRIGGKLMPVGSLRQLGQALVDLHGQHDHQSLLDSERHLGFLDAWIGEPALALIAAVGQKHAEAQELRRRLEALRTGQRDREQRLDMLRFQVTEIENFNPQVGEMEELEAQLSRLKHGERLSHAAQQALSVLRDAETNAADMLGTAVKQLEEVAWLDSTLDAVLEPLRAALYSLEEGSYSLRDYAENIESDPEKLEEIAARIDSLKRLRRKYGDDEEAILQFLHEARLELDLLEDADSNEGELDETLQKLVVELDAVATQLSALRVERAAEFSGLVQQQLQELAMEKAQFSVAVQPKPVDATGADRVEFYFSANVGEPPRPLSKIASGGEISRVMLAIKTAMAGRAGVPTLIFDEVDAGLGGRAAAVVAKKLQELAQHYQVIVISHLPQIASRATSHFRIEKAEKGGRVLTDVRLLREDERVEEIARMLAGEEVGQTALVHAREMLAGV
jgi:DNA repair protein RecN (Recombination protein N)